MKPVAPVRRLILPLLLAVPPWPGALGAETPPAKTDHGAPWEQLYQPPYKVPTEAPKGSALRKELFEILRKKGTPEYRFEGDLRVYRNWAFFTGRTVDAKGNDITNGPEENTDAAALWLRTQDGWRLVAHSFGHSDAFYVIWPDQYGVPEKLLGM